LILYSYFRNILLRKRTKMVSPTPTFNHLDELWRWSSKLRFRKRHLWRISEALLLPREVQSDHGMWTTNEEMRIGLLLRFATTDG
jgi:hypothetical protein